MDPDEKTMFITNLEALVPKQISCFSIRIRVMIREEKNNGVCRI